MTQRAIMYSRAGQKCTQNQLKVEHTCHGLCRRVTFFPQADHHVGEAKSDISWLDLTTSLNRWSSGRLLLRRASINRNILSCDKARINEIQGRIRNVGRSTCSVCWMIVHILLADLACPIRTILIPLLALMRHLDPSRRNEIHPNTQRTQADGHRVHQPQLSSLA